MKFKNPFMLSEPLQRLMELLKNKTEWSVEPFQIVHRSGVRMGWHAPYTIRQQYPKREVQLSISETFRLMKFVEVIVNDHLKMLEAKRPAKQKKVDMLNVLIPPL